jgi:hypothetical protein
LSSDETQGTNTPGAPSPEWRKFEAELFGSESKSEGVPPPAAAAGQPTQSEATRGPMEAPAVAEPATADAGGAEHEITASEGPAAGSPEPVAAPPPASSHSETSGEVARPPDEPDEIAVRAAPFSGDSELERLATAAEIVEALELGFHLGSAVDRIAVASGQGSAGVPALREAAWFIDRYIAIVEGRPLSQTGTRGWEASLAAQTLERTRQFTAAADSAPDATESEP